MRVTKTPVTSEERDWCRENGLCTGCGIRPARPGRVRCERCAEYARRYTAKWRAALDADALEERRRRSREYGRRLRADNPTRNQQDADRLARRREAAIAAGLCTRCARRPARDGRRLCGDCAAKARATDNERRGRRDSRLRRQGRCGYHGCRNRPPEGRKLCDECVERITARQRERAQAGHCIRCGGDLGERTTLRCGDCMLAEKIRKHERNRAERNRAAAAPIEAPSSMCRECGARPAPPGKGRCWACSWHLQAAGDHRP